MTLNIVFLIIIRFFILISLSLRPITANIQIKKVAGQGQKKAGPAAPRIGEQHLGVNFLLDHFRQGMGNKDLEARGTGRSQHKGQPGPVTVEEEQGHAQQVKDADDPHKESW